MLLRNICRDIKPEPTFSAKPIEELKTLKIVLRIEDPSMDIQWTHITITVSNLERSIDFYTTFCGLSVVRDRRREGGGTVWLGPNTPPGKNPTFVLVLGAGEVTSRMDHLGFQCSLRDQVNEIAERGRKLAILVEPPTDAGGSVGYFTMICDPDGHLVEFTHGQPIEGLS